MKGRNEGWGSLTPLAVLPLIRLCNLQSPICNRHSVLNPLTFPNHPIHVTTGSLSFASMGAVPANPPAQVSAELARVRAAQAGDAGAFRLVYEAHVGRVHALCLRLTGEPSWAEELTQDVFVRVWERLGSFRGDSAFGTWLHRLAMNEGLMALRSARRREARVEPRGDPPETPAHAARESEAAIDLERAIAGLPEGCRTVFVLHDVEGLRHEEIAQLTGTAVGTSKAHLFRARRLLREVLDR